MAAKTPAAVKAVHIVTPGAKAPLPRKAATLWAINNAGRILLFEPDLVIAMDDFARDAKAHPEYVKSILGEHCPIYTAKAYKNAQAYPLREIVGWIGRHADIEAWRLLDNSCNYALALALARGFKHIVLSGFRFVPAYNDTLLAFQLVKWQSENYPTAPYWFKYYGEMANLARVPTEPGSESCHFLLGLAAAIGVKIELAGNNEGIMNYDREKFYYGYQEQPRGL